MNNTEPVEMAHFAGERPPAGFQFLTTDVYTFECRHAGCGGMQHQKTPVREFHVTAAQPTAPPGWWWCDDCRKREKLRDSKKSNMSRKLELAAANTHKISWARKNVPDST